MPFEPVETHRGVVVARNGAVAASQPLAVSAGLNVLAGGGTFADAAIAASAVLCVVEPWASHLGGDAFLITFDARTRETLAFNGSGAAPRTATREAYANGIPERGLRAATVPGLVSTWFALHARFGSRPVAELLAPAIGYARDGFAAGPRWVRQFSANADLLASRPELCAALGSDADVQLGDTIRQPALAWTLEQIASEGEAAFYKGIVAERIAAHAARNANGHFSLDDLAAHRTRVLPPLQVGYRGLIVSGQPPPSQGHILLQELALAEGFDLAGMDEADRTHVLVEAKKLAFADRNAFLADPEIATGVPAIESLLTPGYAARRRSLIRLDRALADPPVGDPTAAGTDTTYFLAADKTGSAVSFIQSVFHSFGSAEVAAGTGVLFNNRLTGFSLDPASPNVLAPGKRPAHTLNAWLATHARSGALAHVGGSPGGHVQVQTNLQLLVALVDGGMDPQQAAERWRWQHLAGSAVSGGEPANGGAGILEVESRAGDDLLAALHARGHDAHTIGPWAHGSAAQVLSVLPGGAFAAGSDPRCDGHAAGI